MFLNTLRPKNHFNPRYDSDEDSQVENAQVDALVNLLVGDIFSAYPLVHGTDTDTPASIHHSKTASGDIDHGSVTGLGDDDHPRYMNGESSGLREEHGISLITGSSAASDATMDTSTTTANTISFATSYGATEPTITLGPVGQQSYDGWVEGINTVTSPWSSFDLIVKNYGTTDMSGYSVDGHWKAIG